MFFGAKKDQGRGLTVLTPREMKREPKMKEGEGEGKEGKLIPTPVTEETKIRHQLLQDFEQFARRMRLQYIFHGQNKEPHPFHVKSNWIPPVQPSVALESYLESVKVQLAEIKTIKPEYNLSRNEFRAIAELKHNSKPKKGR